MERLTANDLSRYLRPRPRPARWLWFAIVVLIGASAWASWHAWRLHDATELLQARNERLRARQAALTATKPTANQMEEQKRWAALKAEQSFPWDRVFKAVERATNVDVELLEFQPDKRNRVIVLRGEARHQDALVAYLEALAMQPALAKVYLVHEETVTRDRLETVGFEIKASLMDEQ